MGTTVEINPQKHECNLYDRSTGEDCIPEKLVDITADCSGLKKSQRIHLLFTHDSNGRIVQIVDGTSRTFCNSSIHFFVDRLENEFHVRKIDDTFGQWAGWLGMEKKALRKLIEAQAPQA